MVPLLALGARASLVLGVKVLAAIVADAFLLGLVVVSALTTVVEEASGRLGSALFDVALIVVLLLVIVVMILVILVILVVLALVMLLGAALLKVSLRFGLRVFLVILLITLLIVVLFVVLLVIGLRSGINCWLCTKRSCWCLQAQVLYLFCRAVNYSESASDTSGDKMPGNAYSIKQHF